MAMVLGLFFLIDVTIILLITSVGPGMDSHGSHGEAFV